MPWQLQAVLSPSGRVSPNIMNKSCKNSDFFQKNHQKDLVIFFFLNLFGGFFGKNLCFCNFSNTLKYFILIMTLLFLICSKNSMRSIFFWWVFYVMSIIIACWPVLVFLIFICIVYQRFMATYFIITLSVINIYAVFIIIMYTLYFFVLFCIY